MLVLQIPLRIIDLDFSGLLAGNICSTNDGSSYGVPVATIPLRQQIELDATNTLPISLHCSATVSPTSWDLL